MIQSTVTKKLVSFHNPKGISKALLLFRPGRRKAFIDCYYPTEAYYVHIKALQAQELKIRQRRGLPMDMKISNVYRPVKKLFDALEAMGKLNPKLDDVWFERKNRIDWQTAKFN